MADLLKEVNRLLRRAVRLLVQMVTCGLVTSLVTEFSERKVDMESEGIHHAEGHFAEEVLAEEPGPLEGGSKDAEDTHVSLQGI